jgi:hypothetical protein
MVNIEPPSLFNKHGKPVIPAFEPVSIAKCLLSVPEPPHDGYRIESGTTISTLYLSPLKNQVSIYQLLALKPSVPAP